MESFLYHVHKISLEEMQPMVMSHVLAASASWLRSLLAPSLLGAATPWLKWGTHSLIHLSVADPQHICSVHRASWNLAAGEQRQGHARLAVCIQPPPGWIHQVTEALPHSVHRQPQGWADCCCRSLAWLLWLHPPPHPHCSPLPFIF